MECFVKRARFWATWVLKWAIAAPCLLVSSGCAQVSDRHPDDEDWARYGGTYEEQHFSPLSDINTSNVARLGLSWWFDIPGVVLAESVPLEVHGTLYFATGYSVVRAVEATTGRLLWVYDPGVTRVAGRKLRLLWGIRGIAYWKSKVYVGTHDGRLIAIDARSGRLLWSVATSDPRDLRIISGPPLVFDGRVMIGHGGTDFGPLRGYVTAYDARTGKQLWRFYTVPGNPHKGFENQAMAVAAKTWSGQWWKQGGGGTVWNAMTYDSQLRRVYIGTSNGSPANARLRSPGGGDNLFLASIVALDADSGAYVWHYQTNPAETWDFDATNDMELAELPIDGVRRRVLMQASKNGFFYILDRDTGKLISAEAFAKVTWAQRIDLETGRPVEAAHARDESPHIRTWPSGEGAHGWAPMAFNSMTGLVYIPTLDSSRECGDQGVDLRGHECFGTSSLLAWDPSKQRAAWRVELPGVRNGGVATTAGNLVFQGRCDGKFAAYRADTGEEVWSFDAQVGIAGAPITYEIAGRQYISVMVGYGGGGALLDPRWDARTQSRRLLTFSLDGTARLPPAPPHHQVVPVVDAEFRRDREAEGKGAGYFEGRCAVCHGLDAVAGGMAPDLRESPAILSVPTFREIVQRGALLAAGMPRFGELSAAELESIRQYLRSRAHVLKTHRVRQGAPVGFN